MTADMLEVFKRLGEKKVPLFDERAPVSSESPERPLFLQKEDHVRGSFEC
jgi:hypothetical protein